MARKPKYLDKQRRKTRVEREVWEGVKWFPTQRNDLVNRFSRGLLVPVPDPFIMNRIKTLD